MEENKNPDWKQWIPVYGIYRVVKDAKEGKPSLADGKNYPERVSSFYHGIVISVGLGLIYEGLEKLLQ